MTILLKLRHCRENFFCPRSSQTQRAGKEKAAFIRDIHSGMAKGILKIQNKGTKYAVGVKVTKNRFPDII